MDIHIYIHQESSDRVTERLEQILHAVGHIMSTVTDIKTLITQMNDETNALSAKIDAELKAIADLQAQIAAGSPASQQDLDDITSGLQAVSDRLKVLGSDPAAPIPPTV